MKFEYNIDEVLESLNVIENDNRLSELLREKYATEFDMIRACVKGNLIKKKAVNEILYIAKLNNIPYILAERFLIDSDEANVREQVEIIKKAFDENPTYAIDHLDGVQVIEKFEYVFTVEEFLKEIQVID